MNHYSTVIVGAGAAAMLCAANIKGTKNSVLVLEKMEKPLRKLRITGKGRCNLTNSCSNEDFMKKLKTGKDFFSYSLNSFSTLNTIEYFKKIGAKLTIDRGGRVFPSSMKAIDIANHLENAVRKNGVEIKCKSKIIDISAKKEGGFKVVYLFQDKKYVIDADSVVIATGGMSYPSTGSTGDGYKFARNLGHKTTKVRPSLVPLKIECKHLKNLNRLLLKNISLSLYISKEKVAEQFGEFEFFDYGVGGATLLKISRQAVDALIEKKKVSISLDLKPALSETKLLGRFDREQQALPNLDISGLLRKLMPMSLIKVIEERIAFKGNRKLSTLTLEERKKLIFILKNLSFNVTNYEDFNKAIITAGGISLSEINSTTMESKKHKGLYIIGELLDLDADTGGYNLQIAFSTAFVAAKSITKVNL